MKISSAVMVLALVLASCGTSGPAVTIKNQPCMGCFDGDGLCLLGNLADACGSAGAMCVACGSGAECVSGACVTADGGTMVPPGVGADGGLEDCSEEAKLIYVLDQNRTLASFNPRNIGTSDPFTDLGRVSCAAQPGAEPFSMAVDRSATAWIIYDSGELFTVNVRALPLTCVKTSFVPQLSVAKFGMGFVANEPGSTMETLFISGSDFTSSLTTTKFGTLGTTPPFKVTLQGTLAGAPEMSGTGDGKLWAFFPNVAPPKVAQLSKIDGSVVKSFTAQALAGSPRAWAFAFWGGQFFMFLERDTDLSTHVWKMDSLTGAVSRPINGTGRHIVGAGVSTCAPLEIN
jgi:hypothetical protein